MDKKTKEDYQQDIRRVFEDAAGNLPANELKDLSKEVVEHINGTLATGTSKPKNEDTITT